MQWLLFCEARPVDCDVIWFNVPHLLNTYHYSLLPELLFSQRLWVTVISTHRWYLVGILPLIILLQKNNKTTKKKRAVSTAPIYISFWPQYSFHGQTKLNPVLISWLPQLHYIFTYFFLISITILPNSFFSHSLLLIQRHKYLIILRLCSPIIHPARTFSSLRIVSSHRGICITLKYFHAFNVNK